MLSLCAPFTYADCLMDTTQQQEALSTQKIHHLGLVMDVIDQLGITEYIDKELPLDAAKGAIVSMGQRVAAMITNGLGFVASPLYMYPEFLEDKAVSRLFGKDITAEHFNDDSLGRCLDAIHNYGVDKLFAGLAYRVALNADLCGKSVHLDTTSLSLYGQYDQAEQGAQVAALPKHGYSKDHRPDLKQMIVTLATTGPASLPIWMESHSGNASDQVILQEAAQSMESFRAQLQQAPDTMYVADSAMYSSCVTKGKKLRWLSRVPASIGAAKSLLNKDDKELAWRALPEGYRYTICESQYKGVKQRWCLVFSQQAYKKEVATLEKTIDEEQSHAEKVLWHLSCQKFGCEQDALQAVKQEEKHLKYHKLCVEVVPLLGYCTKGRPAAGASKEVQGYRIAGKVSPDEALVMKLKGTKGRFILATNELNKEALPDEELLTVYKEQQHTERGFRFIKDESFHLSSVYLKNPGRISALMMVMVLCLLVYNYAQYHLRRSLSESGNTIPNQVKKPTSKPTMRYVFQLFDNVQLLRQEDRGVKGPELVLNMTELLRGIVGYFGIRAQTIYGLA